MAEERLGRNRSLETYLGPAPGAGSEITVTVPAGEVWQILAFHAPLTADGSAANRRPHLLVDDGNNVFARYPTSVTQTAGATWFHSWHYEGGSMYASYPANFQSIGFTMLSEGMRLRTFCESLQPGDAWGTPTVYYLQFFA